MTDAIETEDFPAGITLELHYDDSGAGDPRDWDNLSCLLLSQRGYDYPNDAGLDLEDFDTLDDLLKCLKDEHGATNIVKVYKYEHSGTALRVGEGFSDIDREGWDWGCLGLAYTTPERIEVIGTPSELIDECIKGEVEEYGSWLNGEVYGYIVRNDQGDVLDSCWGFVGDSDYCMNEGRSVAQSYVEEAMSKWLSGPVFEGAGL